MIVERPEHTFKDLVNGNAFDHDGTVFIKMKILVDRNVGHRNAVCLETGISKEFCGPEAVEILSNAKVVLCSR